MVDVNGFGQQTPSGPTALQLIKDHTEEEIDRLIMDGEYRQALTKLRSFVLDYAPHKRPEVTHLLSRLNRWELERRTDQTLTDKINDITFATLTLLHEILSTANPSESSFVFGGMDPKLSGARLPDVFVSVAAEASSGVTDSDKLRQHMIQAGQRSRGNSSQLVSLVEIEKTFSSGNFSLGPISLAVLPGHITVVIGKNGSGKSTLLRIIGGLSLQTKGQISYPYLSKERDWAKIRSSISYISSRPFISRYNVRASLEYIAATSGKTGAVNREIVDDYLARYDLERYSAYFWSQLSSGYLMRLELVRALITSPKLLVLDEPLANLDVPTRATFLSELTELTRSLSNPMSIVLSTHHVDEAELIADQLLVLDGGRSKFYGTKHELRQFTKGSIFHVYGEIKRESFIWPTSIDGLAKVGRILGGVALYFFDVITIKEVIARLEGVPNIEILSVVDISASTQTIIGEGGLADELG